MEDRETKDLLFCMAIITASYIVITVLGGIACLVYIFGR